MRPPTAAHPSAPRRCRSSRRSSSPSSSSSPARWCWAACRRRPSPAALRTSAPSPPTPSSVRPPALATCRRIVLTRSLPPLRRCLRHDVGTSRRRRVADPRFVHGAECVRHALHHRRHRRLLHGLQGQGRRGLGAGAAGVHRPDDWLQPRRAAARQADDVQRQAAGWHIHGACWRHLQRQHRRGDVDDER